MKRFVLVVFVSLLFASAGFAQQNPSDAPASKEDVEKYLEVMHARDMMKNMMDLMAKQMHKTIHEQYANAPNLPPDFEARVDKTMSDMLKGMPLDDLLQVMVPVLPEIPHKR